VFLSELPHELPAEGFLNFRLKAEATEI